jgi:hypothetical protein
VVVEVIVLLAFVGLMLVAGALLMGVDDALTSGLGHLSSACWWASSSPCSSPGTRLTSVPWLSFGRLRPLHTNAVIFAFVGNMLFAGVYYSTQRLCQGPHGLDLCRSIHFWGWQAIIVAQR